MLWLVSHASKDECWEWIRYRKECTTDHESLYKGSCFENGLKGCGNVEERSHLFVGTVDQHRRIFRLDETYRQKSMLSSFDMQ